MTIFDVFTLLGGLAFFLFGMSVMGSGLKSLAGNKMESILWKLSSTPLKGLFLGVFVTAVIQSSSATTVMVVSFVNAGMMKVAQCVTLVLGAEIGTTMTGWILTLASTEGASGLARALSASTFVPVFAFIGIGLHMFAKKHVWKSTGSILLGFCLLMNGMTTMSGAMGPLKSDPAFVGLLTLFDNPILAMLAGLVLAAIIQSCSAGVGILQALSVTGVLSLDACLPLIMGINIGCCTPVLLSMMGSSKNGKRAAMAYISSSIIGSIFITVVYEILRLCGALSFMDAAANAVTIAILNTSTRAISVFCMLPFHKLIAKLSYKIIRYNPNEDADSEYLEALTDTTLRYPSTALNLSMAAARKMAEIAQGSIADAISLFDNFDKTVLERVTARETLLDKYEDKLGDYLMRLLAAEALPDQEAVVEKILSSISDMERMGDHAQNIAELAVEMQEKKQVFSPEAAVELNTVAAALSEITQLAVKSYCEDDDKQALLVEPLEEVIDIICDELKLRHVNRLQAGKCTISVGFVFNDLVTNFERISDHCSNLAICTLKAGNPSYMPHEYSSNAEETTVFTEAFLRFTEKYVSDL